MQETSNGFHDEYRWLSNFWESPMIVNIQGYEYRFLTGEHLYQAYKLNCLQPGEDLKGWLDTIASADTPGGAKRLGRALPIDTVKWDELAIHYMGETIRNKYEQNISLRDKLKATGDLQLVEYNTWNDTFWGVDLETGKGQNCLGKLLMMYREGL